jgi:energy-coupling factor transporter transmembrane protein EcfT
MAKQRTFWPHEKPGKVSLWFAVAAFALWVVLPLLTSAFRETVPVTDTWVMPFIGVVGVAIAAAVNLFTYVFNRQRSVTNLIALSLTVSFTVFSAAFLIGEGLAGV